MKKLFIVFEGIDSSGKSTQAELLLNYFGSVGERAVISPEPTNGIIGNLIRQALKQRIIFSNAQLQREGAPAPSLSIQNKREARGIRREPASRDRLNRDRALFDEQMAYLFAADRHDHLYNDFDGVFKLIDDGIHVISSRYYFSSLAYNCDTREQYDFVSSLNAKFPNPDLTIYLDLPIPVSLARLDKRTSTEIYETQEKLAKVSQNYQQIFDDYQGALLTIDATKSPQDIHHNIAKYIENFQTN